MLEQQLEFLEAELDHERSAHDSLQAELDHERSARESLQAELDHERSARTFSQQQQERLEQQLALAVEGAKSTKIQLAQWQAESQQLTTKLRQARDGALAQVRQLQRQQLEKSGDDEDDPTYANCGIGAHLTPSKRKRKNRNGQETKYTLQGNCRVCKMKTTMICSVCEDENKEYWLCNKRNEGKECFPKHFQEFHAVVASALL
jgi:chromosome segregation ATPase